MTVGLKLLQVGALLAVFCVTASDGRRAHALSRSYMCVNFEFEGAEFPDRCPQILAEFADYWRAQRDGRVYPFIPNATVPLSARVAPVTVSGYAFDERDGNNLAFLRAARVARELARLGVPEHLIQIYGFANRPLVPWEPRAGSNRRVDIVDR